MNKYFNPDNTSESGYLGEFDGSVVSGGITDVEILRITDRNVIARCRRFGRLWLLKGGAPDVKDSIEEQFRLQKEFELHSRIAGYGVAQASGFEEVEGLGPCIVEEWVEGKTLSELLKEGKLGKNERRRIMHDIVKRVGEIHIKGVNLGNLSLDNIMVRDIGGDVVIADLSEACREEGRDDLKSIASIMSQLCPEYRRIARSCEGVEKSEPADYNRLLKSMNRCDKRPKRVMSICGLALLGLLCTGTLIYVWSMRNIIDETYSKVGEMQEIIKTQEKYIAELSDSVKNVSGRMRSLTDDLGKRKNGDETRRRAYLEACSKADRTIEDFHRNVFSRFDLIEADWYDCTFNLTTKLQKIGDEAYNRRRFPELRDEDKKQLYSDVESYYLGRYCHYRSLWEMIFFSREVKANGDPPTWPPKRVKEERKRRAAEKTEASKKEE